MNQEKTGSFLRELRKEKGLTQEQLAEEFHTTNRSVSRWENGKNMPDISLLIELADFYDVDVRELIDGRRKSEMMNEEVREVASKVADYADEQRGRLLTWVRGISLVGVILMVIVLGLQTFSYEEGIIPFLCYGLSLTVFVVMVILALYTNGMLEKLVKKKSLVMWCKIVIIIAGVTVLSLVLKLLLILVPIIMLESTPIKRQTGIENYNKKNIIEEYGSELDSELFLFPDAVEKMQESTFISGLKTGFFDTDGYLILQGKYSKEDYEAEIERLSNVECTVLDITVGVRYDAKSYALPAYVAVDGFDSAYEYALVDEDNYEITYILLSYPQFVNLRGYEEYLKRDVSAYKREGDLSNFSIYARYYKDGVYIEYSDEK